MTTATVLTDWASLFATMPAGAALDAFYEYVCPVDVAKLQAAIIDLDAAIATKVRPGKNAKAAQGARSKLIGDKYEALIEVLFEQSSAVRFDKRVHTATDEIDVLFQVTPFGARIPLLARAGTHFIGEAKCHKKAPPSDLSHSLFGVLSTHGAKLALLFVYCTSRTLHRDIRTSIGMHSAKGSEIVPIGRKQLAQILGGANVLRVLEDQHTAAISMSAKLAV